MLQHSLSELFPNIAREDPRLIPSVTLRHECVDMALAAQRICYYVSLSGVIMQSHIIILYELEPSPLHEIQLLLREDVLQTLVIRVHLTVVSDEKMSPCLQRMYYGC